MAATVRELIEELLPFAPRCAGIVLCTQMHSVVLVNNIGALLTNAITWLDERVLEPHPAGDTYLDHLAARLGPETRLALGNELRPRLPLATLFWLVERGELPPNATPLTLADLVLVQLCGAAPGVEVTNRESHRWRAIPRRLATNGRKLRRGRVAAAARPAWRQVVLSGGLPHQAPLLRDLIGEHFAAPSRLAPKEDTLNGLLALALVCVGRAARVAEAVTTVREHHEQRSHELSN